MSENAQHHSGVEGVGRWLPTTIDTSVAHIARVYDFFLGGKDNFPADREAAARILKGNPGMRDTCREQREYLRRAVRFLAGAGIRQFIDIGTGLPTQENTHEVAQKIAPDARIAYIDNDPIVLAHARVLMADQDHGRTVFIHADARDPGKLLADPELTDVIDFTQPVAVLMIGILHFLPDNENPGELISTLMDAVPPGSYLAISHGTPDFAPAIGDAVQAAYQASSMPCRVRTSAEVMALLKDVELVDPGLVLLAEWRPDGPVPDNRQRITYAAVGRKVP
ncbi:O-methyltransferase involved in polyketide biosynthesis [Catenulispora sp. MAP5-51]|jgi:O-methyltransferase involved in polyketide biosynthesis|uniref:SAM-dependent methyltransferase n=1 Tax=Catenulispora sp. MAP5-51 TaxID=3156298 RepID=UPI0035130F1F